MKKFKVAILCMIALAMTLLTDFSSSRWIDDSTNGQGAMMSIYALSQELTVPNHSVPEPSALMMLSVCGLIGWTARKKRRHRR